MRVLDRVLVVARHHLARDRPLDRAPPGRAARPDATSGAVRRRAGAGADRGLSLRQAPAGYADARSRWISYPAVGAESTDHAPRARSRNSLAAGRPGSAYQNSGPSPS